MGKLRTMAVSIAALLCLAVAAAQGGTLTVAQGTGPETLDAQRTTVQQTLNVAYHVNETLFLLDYASGEIVPHLGTAYRAVAEDLWEVEIREGVSFSNGEPLNAEAVRFSLMRVKQPELNSPAVIYVSAIEDVTVVDEHTVHIRTDGPRPILPLYLTRVAIVPPGYIAEVGDAEFAQRPVGTGPYVVQRWVRDDRVVLRANEGHWRGRPSLDEIVFVAIPEAATRMAALQTGEADIVTQVSIDQAPMLARSGIQVLEVPGLRLMMLAFNLAGEEGSTPLYDRRVRQALNYAVDKEALVRDILGGYAKVLDGQPLSSEYFGYDPSVEAYPHDPERARELLAEAGYGPDAPLSFTIYGPQGRYIRDSEILQAIGGQLRNVGVNADVQVLEWGIFISRLLAKDFDTAAFWGASTVPDGDVWLSSMLSSGAAYSTYANPDFDALVREAGQTVDPAARLALYHQAAQMTHDDAPFIYLYQQVDLYGVAPRVQGWSPNPDESIDLWDVTVE